MKTPYLDYQISYLKTLKHDDSLSQEGEESLAEYLAIKEKINALGGPGNFKCIDATVKSRVEHNLEVIISGTCKRCGLYHTI